MCATLLSFSSSYLSEIVGTVKRRFDWQIHSFLCVWYLGNSPLVKINFFPSLFFSLFFKDVFGWFLAIYCKMIFCEKKKAKFPLRCHTLSSSNWFFSFSWLDWGHSTASNQLQLWERSKTMLSTWFLFYVIITMLAWNKNGVIGFDLIQRQDFHHHSLKMLLEGHGFGLFLKCFLW